MGSVLVAARGARLVNAAHFLRTESRPSFAGRDGPDDGDAGDHHADRENCHQDRWGHDSRSVVRTTNKRMPRPLSADVARSLRGPAYGEEHSPRVSCPLDGTAARATTGALAEPPLATIVARHRRALARAAGVDRWQSVRTARGRFHSATP